MAEKKNQAASAADTKREYRLKTYYAEKVVPALMAKFNYKNVNQGPKLVKITINSGLGDVKDNGKSIQLAQEELKLIELNAEISWHRDAVAKIGWTD